MSDEDQKSSWLTPSSAEYADEGDMTGRRMLVAALTVIILAIFGGLIWYSYLEGNKNGPVPVIRADNAVVKEKPDNPGGMQVPDQDKAVFNRITSEDAEKAEKLAPSAELPAQRPVEEVKQDAAQADEESRQALLPPTKEAAPQNEPAPMPVVEDKKTGDFLIQLGAFGKKASAESLWQKIQQDNKSLLDGLSLDIMMVDLGKKGVLYRLRGGMIDGRDRADTICNKLKMKKQACMVVTK